MPNEEIMIQSRSWVYILTSLLLFGCTAHIDKVTKFRVEGTVIEQGSRMPVQGAVLFFTDTGFDYVRSKNISVQQVGQSDSSGALNLKFDYWWGVNKSFFTGNPPQTFILSLEHPAHQSLKIPLRAADLPGTGNEVHINLGIVKLTARDPVAGRP